jgi:hypothetical protein
MKWQIDWPLILEVAKGITNDLAALWWWFCAGILLLAIAQWLKNKSP